MPKYHFQIIADIVAPIKYETLLLSLVLLIFISPYMIHAPMGELFISFVLLFALITIVFTMLKVRWHFFTALSLAILDLSFYILFMFYRTNTLEAVENGITFVLFTFAIVIIFSEILSGKKITKETVFGALCVYLLIAVSYSSLFSIVETLAPGSFQYNSAVYAGETLLRPFDMIYFSFTTLTTVGFGDIIPTNMYAKSVVILEEITGVLYLAAIVSRLVAGMRE